MISPEQMRAMSNTAAGIARAKHRAPQLVEQQDLGMLHVHLRSMPNLGSYIPAGWELVNASELAGAEAYARGYAGPDDECLFVDSSGFGSSGEPAISFSELCQWVSERGAGFGYAIVEEGQFQVVIGVFRKSAAKSARTPVGTVSEVAEAFATRRAMRGAGCAIYTDGATVWSYGPHWPIAHWRGLDLVVNSGKYSLTTTKHTSRVLGACAKHCSVKPTYVSTREILAMVEAEEEAQAA